MSYGSRQEAMIRSCIEGASIALSNELEKVEGEPSRSARIEAIGVIMGTVTQLWQRFPIQLPRREAEKVVAAIEWFRETHEAELQAPEILIALILGLGEQLKAALKPKQGPQAAQHLQRALAGKYGVVVFLLQQIQLLYDAFDCRGQEVEMIVRGGELCDLLLARQT